MLLRSYLRSFYGQFSDSMSDENDDYINVNENNQNNFNHNNTFNNVNSVQFKNREDAPLAVYVSLYYFISIKSKCPPQVTSVNISQEINIHFLIFSK